MIRSFFRNVLGTNFRILIRLVLEILLGILLGTNFRILIRISNNFRILELSLEGIINIIRFFKLELGLKK